MKKKFHFPFIAWPLPIYQDNCLLLKLTKHEQNYKGRYLKLNYDNQSKCNDVPIRSGEIFATLLLPDVNVKCYWEKSGSIFTSLP